MRAPATLLALSLSALSLVPLVGCESELDNKPAAAVEAAPAAAPTPTPQPAKGLTVPAGATPLAAASRIEWVGAKVTKDHQGGFKALDGYATLEGGAVKSAKVVIDTTSLFSDSEKLTKHLKDPDFFDVGTFPAATFEVTGVAEGGDGEATHTVTGTLDLHGVQNEITFPATVTVADGRATIAAEFLLNRKDFGMAYPGKPDDLIREEVLVKGQLVFGS